MYDAVVNFVFKSYTTLTTPRLHH